MYISRILRILAPLAVSIAAAALSPLCAATIVVTSSDQPTANTIYAVASWTSTASYNNVSISIGMQQFCAGKTPSECDAQTGYYAAFLTTAFGPGTTVADIVANSSGGVVLPPGVVTNVPLMSGLTLTAGTTYYLSVNADPASGNGAWAYIYPNDITTTLAPGTTLFNPSFINNPNIFFWTSEISAVDTSGSQPWFTVTGDLVTGSGSGEVPEPSSLALVAGGLAAVELRRLRRL